MCSLRPLVRPEFRARAMAARQERRQAWSAADRELYEPHLRRLVREGELSKRVKLDALALILEQGRFKTPYEAGCLPSGNPERTAAEEAIVWDIAPDALGQMPTFGYLATVCDVSVPETRATLHMAYGSARVMLKDEVRPKCTVFFADSLWAIRHDDGAPAPLDAPDELCWLPDRGPPNDRLGLDEGGPDEVVEIQIIGGLSRDEIRSVCFDFEPPQTIIDALATRKIEWSVNPMPALPEDASLVRDVLSASASPK